MSALISVGLTCLFCVIIGIIGEIVDARNRYLLRKELEP